MHYTFVFWCLILKIIRANSVPQDNIDTLFDISDVNEGSSVLDNAASEVFSSNIDPLVSSSVSNEYFYPDDLSQEVASLGTDPNTCFSETADSSDDPQESSILRRGSVCSASTFTPIIPYPESWQQKPEGKSKAPPIDKNPCAKHGIMKILVTCGGPIVPQGPDAITVWNCVLGKLYCTQGSQSNESSY